MSRSLTTNISDERAREFYAYDLVALSNEGAIPANDSFLSLDVISSNSPTTTIGFLSRDPIGFEGGDANLYRYVRGKPLVATDPSGLFAVTCRAVHGYRGFLFRHCQFDDTCTPGWVDDPIYGPRSVLQTCYDVWLEDSDTRTLDNGLACECATEDDINACIRRHPGGRPCNSTYGSNCQSDTIETISSCCLNTDWEPSWYAGSWGECLEWEQRGNPLTGYYRECVRWSSGVGGTNPNRIE